MPCNVRVILVTNVPCTVYETCWTVQTNHVTVCITRTALLQHMGLNELVVCQQSPCNDKKVSRTYQHVSMALNGSVFCKLAPPLLGVRSKRKTLALICCIYLQYQLIIMYFYHFQGLTYVRKHLVQLISSVGSFSQ